MTVEQIINALIGVPGNVEIKISSSYGNNYGVAVIDRKLLADDETAVKA